MTRLWHGVQERVVAGLPSIAFLPAGDTAAGPQHVSFQGRGGLFVTIGCGSPPTWAYGSSMRPGGSVISQRLPNGGAEELIWW